MSVCLSSKTRMAPIWRGPRHSATDTVGTDAAGSDLDTADMDMDTVDTDTGKFPDSSDDLILCE